MAPTQIHLLHFTISVPFSYRHGRSGGRGGGGQCASAGKTAPGLYGAAAAQWVHVWDAAVAKVIQYCRRAHHASSSSCRSVDQSIRSLLSGREALLQERLEWERQKAAVANSRLRQEQEVQAEREDWKRERALLRREIERLGATMCTVEKQKEAAQMAHQEVRGANQGCGMQTECAVWWRCVGQVRCAVLGRCGTDGGMCVRLLV